MVLEPGSLPSLALFSCPVNSIPAAPTPSLLCPMQSLMDSRVWSSHLWLFLFLYEPQGWTAELWGGGGLGGGEFCEEKHRGRNDRVWGEKKRKGTDLHLSWTVVQRQGGSFFSQTDLNITTGLTIYLIVCARHWPELWISVSTSGQWA